MQVGKWFITWQLEFGPHVPGHGFWHLDRMQPRFDGQSELITHSGRHPSYGLPKNSGKHIHEPTPFCSLQMAFGPHGDGVQGEVGITKDKVYKVIYTYVNTIKIVIKNQLLTWLYVTFYERVSSITLRTSTHWCMTYNSTFSIWSTRTRARIFTILIYAS